FSFDVSDLETADGAGSSIPLPGLCPSRLALHRQQMSGEVERGRLAVTLQPCFADLWDGFFEDQADQRVADGRKFREASLQISGDRRDIGHYSTSAILALRVSASHA